MNDVFRLLLLTPLIAGSPSVGLSQEAQVELGVGSSDDLGQFVFSNDASAEIYHLQQFDFWKRVQLQAVAISNPSRLREFEVVNALSVSDISAVDIGAIRQSLPDDFSSVRVGYLMPDGTFERTSTLSSACADVSVVGTIEDTCSDENELLDSLLRVLSRHDDVRHGGDEAVVTQDLRVIWPSNNSGQNEFEQFLLSRDR